MLEDPFLISRPAPFALFLPPGTPFPQTLLVANEARFLQPFRLMTLGAK